MKYQAKKNSEDGRRNSGRELSLSTLLQIVGGQAPQANPSLTLGPIPIKAWTEGDFNADG